MSRVNVRIFETDPSAKPKPRETSDIVGKFRSGKMEGRSPVSLDKWRVTTGDPEVAREVARLMGGEPAEWETSGEDSIEVLTDSASVKVIVDGVSAVSSDLKLWGLNGAIIHHCDGVVFIGADDDRIGQPCGCPELLSERKALARDGRGPRPDTRIDFRMADAPHLGVFRMASGAWDLVRVLHETLNDLEDACDDGPALCTLKLAMVSYVPKGGPMKGRTVEYRKPTLTVHGPAQVPAQVPADDADLPF